MDLIWYVQTYLRGEWASDPLLHYMTEGARKGYSLKPRLPVTFRCPTSYKKHSGKPRRICLFAGYDPDGLIDPVAVEYIRDLARHADIYYLADCYIAPRELTKLAHLVKGAWAERHGRYDFGSWSLLSQKIGWDLIDSYDELILANDSCYLMRSLEGIFAEMDSRECDWWGLQATKGLASTFATQALAEELDLKALKSDWLSRFEADTTYDFLVGSYFLVFRKTVLSDQCVRDVLTNVSEEKSKLNIIRKYEIGLTRLLISRGYEFETFVRAVYPHQPIYTDTGFELIKQGFPLLKKYHLIENHYKITNLRRWKDKVISSGITKDLSIYEDNLKRTGDNSKIFRSHDIEVYNINTPLSNTQLISADKVTPKYDNWWAFPVCSHSHLFNDNIRALFEHVKNNLDIKKIVLTRSKAVEIDGVNVEVFPLNSREGQFYLLRARHIFLKHGVRSNLGVHLSGELHCFHNLWHGIPLKRIGYASLDTQHRLDHVARENKLLTSVIAASKIDRNAMAAAYWPLTINNIWTTGLPRHDLILKPEILLPDDMKSQQEYLREILMGRKFILFAPTFRRDQGNGYYSFSSDERNALASLLRQAGYVMGIREHMADRTRQYTSQLCGEEFIAVPESVFPCVEVLLREADIVATDYSSVFIDFLLTGRPVISFAYDYEKYIREERGLFYDLEWCFPGFITKTFGEFVSAIEKSILGMDENEKTVYSHKRKIFIEKEDSGNSQRVVEHVSSLNKGDITIFDVLNKNVCANFTRSILWVYERGLEREARYRAFNLAPETETMGWRNQFVSRERLSIDHMIQAEVAIFCGVLVTENILDLAEGFRRSGKKLILDLTAPVFDFDLVERDEYYLDHPEDQVRLRLQCAYSAKIMHSADLVTVSTPALARLVESKDLRARYLPNSLSSAVIARYSHRPRDVTDGTIRICYLSTSTSNDSEFQVICGAVSKLLSERGDVEFHIAVPAADGEDELGRLTEGWVRHAYSNYDAMHDILDRMHINLAPLAADPLIDYKSEIKLVEAGLHSIPSIASPSESIEAFIRHGENGLIARTEAEWYLAILDLVTDSSLRQAAGRAARETVLRKYAASVVSKSLLNATFVDQH
ncbi:CDP-glycerol glycerophosphotransferase family protein [Sphingobium fuliginis]|uniref:Glycosyltransferase n=1 Tax=Sphingobium fuliginis ATCC 27551 TaxID=1208342 RepID=A0A5B8CFF0_SPHSA|nr:CDP-glycerol glycerophosphotransferase family protein [Sphingobium fuliginis]QDC38073.1 glycosyltransferase [Sphingobium fuliginis ATCC 27551]